MRRLLFAITLVSAAAIGYEILLMRMLSVVQWHHFAYMIISLALLGYGVSGTFIALFRDSLTNHFIEAFAGCALLFSIAMLACFAAAQLVPFNALEIVWDGTQLLNLCGLYLIFFVPFFFAACCIGLAFTSLHQYVSRIYFSDLVGAGAGALLLIAVLFVLMPRHALLVLVGLALGASALAGLESRRRRLFAAVQIVWLGLLVTGVPGDWLALRLSEYKGLSQALQVVDARVIRTASSPLGLITVVESPTVPFHYAPGLSLATRHTPPEQLAVFTDGDAMSVINRAGAGRVGLEFLGDMTAALPILLLEEPEVLVLGAGAGAEVLLALYNGASRVDAVELNPQVTALVADVYAGFAGHLYDDPRVNLHTREARGFVMQSDRSWDLIHLGLLDSFGASGSGVQSLHENYLYTVEGLQEYLEHLTPGGVLSVTRWLKLPPRDSLKLFATAVRSLRNTGVGEPGRRLAMIRSWNTTTLLVKNGEFTASEISRIHEFCRSQSFDIVYYAGMPASAANRYNILDKPYLFEAANALLSANPEDFFERYKFHVEPATDDRPYFFHFFRWGSLREILTLRKQGGAGLIEWGYLVLVATLVQAVLAGAVLILLPLLRFSPAWPSGTGARMGGYFFLLGLAFLFIEIAFIQKFMLFLSHPLYSVSVVLAGFLIFAGLGSAYTARRQPPLAMVVGWIVALTLIYIVALPVVFDELMGVNDILKVALSFVVIAPLALAMGMPFPLGLQRLVDLAPDFIPWAWGLNGFASVLSAALATLFAIEFGFNAVVILALLAYAGAAATINRWTG